MRWDAARAFRAGRWELSSPGFEVDWGGVKSKGRCFPPGKTTWKGVDEKGSLPLLDVGYRRSLGGFPWSLARCSVYAGLLGPKSFHSKPSATDREREIGLDLLPRCLEHSAAALGAAHLAPESACFTTLGG